MTTQRWAATLVLVLTGLWLGCKGEEGQSSGNATGTTGATGATGTTGTGGSGAAGGDASAGGSGDGGGAGGEAGAGGTGGAGGSGSGGVPWNKRFGDAGYQNLVGTALDAAGNIYVTGFHDGLVDFGGAPLSSEGLFDIFVAKLDPLGNHVWSRHFGGPEDEYAEGIAVDSAGNVLLIGQTEGSIDFGGGSLTSAGAQDIYIAKLDSEGNHVWSKRFGDAKFQASHGVALDGADNVLVTGAFHGSIDFGGGPLVATGLHDIFVVKLDPQGNHLWSRRFGEGGASSARSIAVDAAGNVLLTGYFSTAVDFGGGVLTCAEPYDVFLAKLDASGNHVWSKGFIQPENQYGDSVAVDSAGNVFITGYFRAEIDFGLGPLVYKGDYDVYVAKFDADGNAIWNRRLGGPFLDIPRGLSVDGAGDVLVIGQFEGEVDFGGGPLIGNNYGEPWDSFALKLDGAGNHVWSMSLGDKGGGDIFRRSILSDGAGHVILGGSFGEQVDFGLGPLMSAGSQDIYLAKLVK